MVEWWPWMTWRIMWAHLSNQLRHATVVMTYGKFPQMVKALLHWWPSISLKLMTFLVNIYSSPVLLSLWTLVIKHNSTEYLHLLIESIQLSFTDTTWYCTDPCKVKIPVDEMLSKEYAAQRRSLIKPDRWWYCHAYCMITWCTPQSITTPHQGYLHW